MATSPDDMPPTSSPEEITALQARIKELEDQLAAPAAEATPATTPRQRHAWRTIVTAILLALAFVLAPLSVLAQWAHDEIGDTDRYVDTVAPLATDPAVQAAVTNRVTAEIVSYVNVDELTSEALTALSTQDFIPDRASGILPSLAIPLSNAIEGFIRDAVEKVVYSDGFEQAWVEANRQAHEQMVVVLTGEDTGAVQVTDNAVRVNIATFVEATKQVLIEDGFAFAERIPEINATFTLFESKDIGKAQKAFALLDTLARVLPILTLLLIFTAVWVSNNRRRTWVAAGMGVAAAMLLLGLTLNLLRPFYLDALPPEVQSTAAAGAVYDSLTYFIRVALRAVGVVALAVAVAALLMAPTGAGAAVRHGISGGIGRLRDAAGGAGLDTGPVGEFLSTYRAFARTAVVTLGAVVYLAVDHPTVQTSVLVISAVVLLLVLLEFLAAPTRPEEEQDQPQQEEEALTG